jgi:hypothetical protein
MDATETRHNKTQTKPLLLHLIPHLLPYFLLHPPIFSLNSFAFFISILPPLPLFLPLLLLLLPTPVSLLPLLLRFLLHCKLAAARTNWNFSKENRVSVIKTPTTAVAAARASSLSASASASFSAFSLFSFFASSVCNTMNQHECLI